MRQKNEKKFFKNWQAKVLSLLFAVFLFFMFAYSVQEKRVVDFPLDVIMPQGFRATSIVPEKVQLVLTGSEKEIYMVDVSKISLSADFSGINREGVAAVPVDINYTELLDYLNLTPVSFTTEPEYVKVFFEVK
ncbi:MAG: CdaR family protein [Sphaerochaetaceae bacterium]|nr:CdaR family protein [Sphaerochaetaceae bacterium]